MSQFSILINNYNYAQHLGEAIASAANQGALAAEILVVDDGSSDDSLEIARQWKKKDDRVRVIAKPNGGQLSAINAGFERTSGELLCFLDADDTYGPGYVDRLAAVYKEKPWIDFAACQCAFENRNARGPCWQTLDRSHDFGQTLLRTLLAHEFIGGSTSTISMRRSLAARFLPCPLESEWRLNAR